MMMVVAMRETKVAMMATLLHFVHIHRRVEAWVSYREYQLEMARLRDREAERQAERERRAEVREARKAEREAREAAREAREAERQAREREWEIEQARWTVFYSYLTADHKLM